MTGDFIPPSRKLYLTPDAPVEGRFCRQLSIPDTPEWVGLVDGLLSTFAEPETWRKFGDLTPEQTAEAFLAILLESWALDGCGIPSDVPAPFWNDAEDSDDTLPVLEQIWYGLWDGTFTEDIDIWLIAGFIAYSGQIGAAITFVTLAKQFKLAWKSGDLGGIIRVFIDGADAGTVDTYGATAGIVEREYAGDPDEDEHTILMVLESVPEAFAAQQMSENVDAPMMVIRKRLDEGEVGSPDLRYDPDGDTIEFWNGVEWVQSPGADPRSADTFRLPPLTGDARCDAAKRMVAQIEEQVNRAIQFQSVAGIASSFLLGLGLLVTGIGVLTGLFILIADTMVSIGIAAIINAMTSEVYDELECILYCNLQPNGQLSEASLGDIRTQVDAEIGGVAAVVLNLMFDAFGSVMLSNAAVIRSETGTCDCPDCEWCVRFDFTIDDHGWSPVAFNNTVTSWAAGAGWQGTQTAITGGVSTIAAATITIPSTFITQIVVTSRSTGLVGAESSSAYSSTGGINSPPQHFTTTVVGNNVDLSDGWNPNANVTQIWIRGQNNAINSGVPSHGTPFIRSVVIRGMGDNPFSDDVLC